MRIALVWNAPFVHPSLTTAYADYVSGLAALGCEFQAFCQAGTETAFPFPVEVFDGEATISCAAFWAGRGLDVGILITWHRMAGVLQAMRAAGMRTVAIGDSDGQVSLRYHPWPTFRYRTYLQPTWRLKLGAAKFWLSEHLFRGRTHDEILIAATEAADVFALGAPGNVALYRQFLLARGATKAAARVAFIPYPVGEAFCSAPVEVTRKDRVIAVGRWDSVQKNAPLLAATLERLAVARRGTEFLIVGPGAESAFAGIANRNPSIQLVGALPRPRVRGLMAAARILLLASRWEGAPIVANEMLALGGTVVGTPIPSLASLLADGRFGRVSRVHTASALARAIQAELADWDQGRRSPLDIANHWRPLLSPVAVTRRFLRLLNADCQPCAATVDVGW
jgi:glycosyltransferase involved in cell wall biosynthesis